jgi:DNA-directed RNA polymerase specialized sigma24 family protein
MARPVERDERLLRSLYTEHGGPLLGYAQRLTGGDRQQAEDVPPGTVRSRTFYALRALRVALEERGVIGT